MKEDRPAGPGDPVDPSVGQGMGDASPSSSGLEAFQSYAEEVFLIVLKSVSTC